MVTKIATLLLVLTCSGSASALAAESTCFGNVSNGRLENGVKLPTSGRNFSAYSSLGSSLGRTYVHSKVLEVVLAAYEAVERSVPGKVFVYGETGWAAGGRIRPHRTHRNGTSVDFMVPVLDKTGHSVPLPTGPGNRFGYGIDFDKDGRFGNYIIDFEVMAEHLYQLHVAAQAHGVGLALIIFDPRLQPELFRTSRGRFLQEHLNFMKGEAWVRHDEHYHVDFAIPCKPVSG